MRVDLKDLLIIIKPGSDVYSVLDDLLYVDYKQFQTITIVIDNNLPNDMIEKVARYFYFFNEKYINVAKVSVCTNNQDLIDEIKSKTFYINKHFQKEFIFNNLEDIKNNTYDKIIVFNPNLTMYNGQKIKDVL